MATFVKQSHRDMPPPGWLHVNGVSLSTDVHQHTADNRTKSLTSPVPPSTPPMLSPPNAVPFTATMSDGQYNHREYQKLDNADLPKKLFIDRQIKKVKSLPGLIKGTALSRHTSLHSAPNTNPIVANLSSNNSHDDSYPVGAVDNDDDFSPVHHHHERISETRRPRVSFSDFNKVQFIEGSSEASQQSTLRRHRHRSSKKTTAMIPNNPVSPPSIQHTQSLYTPYRPSSRQQSIGQELNIKKQQLIPSPRIHSSRITHLPDILNQSIPLETAIHEKYVLQREKPLLRLPEPAVEVPINSSTEISRESTRAGGNRSSALQNYSDQFYDNGINTIFNSSSISSSLTNRYRPSLRTISLRQQFASPTRTKTTTLSNNYQTSTNPRRSASLKQSTTRIHSSDDDHEDTHNNRLLATYESRPMTGVTPSKQLKRNYLIHFHSKNPFNGNDSNESSRHSNKSNFHESSQERFQNILKVVRPPYVTNLNGSNHDLALHTATNNTNGSIRSSGTNSGNGSHEFHIATNTIYV